MRQTLPWLLLGALAVVTGLALSSATPDDTFISLRYARHLAAGDGLVFNPGEHVEGFSNPLWTLVLSGLLWLGLPALLAAKLLGILVFAATVVLLGRVQERAFPTAAWPARLAPALFLALDPCSAYWAGSGMETPLAALLVACLLAVLLGTAPRRRNIGAGIVLGLLCLTRPEAPMYALVLGPWLWCLGRWRAVAQAAVAAAAVFGPYLLFRILYYHDLLPNTAYAKRTAGWNELVQDGLVYLHWWRAVMGPWVWVLAAAAGMGLLAVLVRPRMPAPRVVGIALPFLVVQILFVLASGGDWMEGFRFLVPVAPAFALAFGAALAGLPAAAAAVVLAALLVGNGGAVAGLAARHPDAWERPFQLDQRGPWHAMLDRLEPMIPRGSLVAAHEIGNLGFRLDGRRILDIWGLTDRAVARSPRNLGMLHGTSGDADLVLARRPDFIVAWEMGDKNGHRHIQTAVLELMRTRVFRLEYQETARIPEAEPTWSGWLRETVVWQRREPRMPEAPSAAVDVAQPATLDQVLEGLYREQDGLRWCADQFTALLAVPAGASRVVVTGGFPPGAELRCRIGAADAGLALAPAAGLSQVEFPLPAGLPPAAPVEVTLLGRPVHRDARDPRHKVFVLQRVAVQ